MDDERLVVEVEKYVELYDQSSRHYKDNSKKFIAWRAIALEIGSSGDFLHLYCSAAVAPPPVGARGVLLTRVKCAPCRCAGDCVDQHRTSNSGGGNSALALQLSSGSTIPFSGAELTPPELPPKGSREEEAWSRKGLYSWSCRTAAELPQPELLVRWSCHLASASVQLPEYTAGLRPDGFDGGRQLRREELGGSPAAQLPEYNPLILHVSSDSSLVNGQQLICINATDTRNSAS
ncbi:unnamed protein product [Boreogadus saida]